MLKKKNIHAARNFLTPAINFLNNGPLLNITEDKDPGVCIASPRISLRVFFFC